MSRRIRKKIIGGKAPWERKIKIWFDEMGYDCIAFGVMVSRRGISSVAKSKRGLLCSLAQGNIKLCHCIKKWAKKGAKLRELLHQRAMEEDFYGVETTRVGFAGTKQATD